MNSKLLRLSLFAILLCTMQRASAQCEYTLNMFDLFGDGWNGGLLLIKTGTTTDTIGMDNISGDGKDSTVLVTIQSGAPLTLVWLPGAYDSEVRFFLYNNDGTLVFKDSIPGAGVVFTGTGACVSCLKPTGLKNVNVYDTHAKLSWTPSSTSTASGWWVVYGPKGFVPGPGVGDSVYVTQPKINLTGLQRKKFYDWYIVQDCGNGDHSLLAGPVSFETYWTNDVGMIGVVSPVSGCNLGTETISIVMKNFGAAPQTLIPFYYTVNDLDPGVPQPQDGFYTGVIGKDSSETIPFETQFDFSQPGEYVIKVFTQMTGDSDMTNDTFTYRIVNRIVAPYIQNFETWEGGWHVDTASYLPSWAFGTPNDSFKLVINKAASGKNAWVTNLKGRFNTGEFSYLDSPCFDFSNLTEDPVIEFSLNTDMDSTIDGGYLEYTTDGTTWKRVGAVGEGLNWYNKNFPFSALGDAWTGGTNGWVTARHHLTGLGGKSDVHLRFAFVGGNPFFASGDGMGVDDVHIYVPVPKDLAAQVVTTAGGLTLCGLAKDSVEFTFANLGNTNQNFYKLAYSINGGTPVIENVSHPLAPDHTYTYRFHTTFDSRDGMFNIKCWTLLTGEQMPSNDTVVYMVNHKPIPVPFVENFEDPILAGLIPAGWTSTGGSVTNLHNNVSHVYGINMYINNSSFTLDAPRFGVISANDSLRFDYRITNWSSGTVPTILVPGTKIEVQASTDCGQTFQTIYTISSVNHVPSVTMKSVNVGLGQFAGQSIRLRYLGTWSAGDFWFDLDNINIRACASDMMLSAVTTPSAPGQNNGQAVVTVGVGNPPYTYTWSNGSVLNVPNITNLAGGTSTVTVTDALGCSNTLTITIEITATNEIEGLTAFGLQPNPTPGLLTMHAAFDRSVDASLEVLNLLGQDVWETHQTRVSGLSEQVDLTPYPDGMYLVRLTVDRQSITRKIVKGSH
jgi:hypothetical protein